MFAFNKHVSTARRATALVRRFGSRNFHQNTKKSWFGTAIAVIGLVASERIYKYASGNSLFGLTPEIAAVPKTANDAAPTEASAVLPAAFVTGMQAILGERFSMDPTEREHHSKDYSYHKRGMPHAVAYPLTTEEVQQILRLCNEHRVPVVPYGSGTSLEGNTPAVCGGVTLSFAKMNQIIELHEEDMDVVVQPGITWGDLNKAIRHTNLFFPLDPGAGASIGGMVSTSCSGTNAVRHGTMKENVLALKVVLPNGDIVKTANRARKSSAGYDLTHLFIGAEGTLGAVTEVTLKLKRIPENASVAVCTFPSVKHAANAVIETLQNNVNVGRVEIIDDVMIKALNRNSGLNLVETPTLFFEFNGTKAQLEEQIEQVRTITGRHSGSDFKFATDERERADLWRARGQAFWAASTLRPGYDVLTTDVCVPISRLAECISETKEDLIRSNVVAPIVGHVGDGNFHLFMLLNFNDPEQVREAEEINTRLVRRAIRMDGTCTGEHAVGIGKKKFLREEKGDEAVRLMRTIKTAIDPNNIMNPGKVIPDETD